MSLWRKPNERQYLRRVSAPCDHLKPFWFRQFCRHLEAEERGTDPASLIGRWLTLDAMTWEQRGPRLEMNIPEDVAHFLDDADVRSKDPRYGEYQRRQVREWLNAQ